MSTKEIEAVKKYVRATNYLSAAQIYLQDNFFLKEPLKPEHIKARLLGHWGTCPGINFVYANLNNLIRKTNSEMILVIGPGHGFPALQSNLFIEGSLSRVEPEKIPYDSRGISEIVKKFSWPYGYPSHSNPEAPGVILEGGELGYALSTSFGSILDNPELITVCLVGDGEAETGPTAGAWHINKLIDPAKNGAVLPILHLNKYKISGPTVYGRMSDKELRSLFSGYGYKPYFVEGDGDGVYKKMSKTLEKVHKEIRAIQEKARKEKVTSPKFPMIIMKTPKGWTGIKELHGEKIEGNHLSHQVVGPNAKNDPEELRAIEKWLKSYKFEELFNEENGFCNEIKSLVPKENLVMGTNKNTMGGEKAYKPLKLSNIQDFCENLEERGLEEKSSMKAVGAYLNQVFKDNKDNFRFMCPDETYSNKLDKIFETAARAYVWPHKPWDKDLKYDGHVMEMLSEHNLQGLAQGYVLTGRHSVFASYEAFVQIVASMADQYAKFLKIARQTQWRGNISSLNYILTSSGWRQEHNGFSHQNPGFIDGILQRQGNFVNAYFPADANMSIATIKKMLDSRNEINILIGGKREIPIWLNINEVEKQMANGLMIWDFASDENPDLIMSSAGDYVTKEVLAAISLIKEELPEVKIRYVNVSALSATGFGNCSKLCSQEEFNKLYTEDKPVIFNFHGYPQTIKQILFDYCESPDRFTVRGYEEQGSTTTPFDMQVRNRTDRYNLAIQAFTDLSKTGVLDKSQSGKLIKKYTHKLIDHNAYIKKYGDDPKEIENWKWKNT